MKKIISRIISAAVCTGILFGTASAVSAKSVYVEPDYPIHGNKCGKVRIWPEVNREVYVTITQCTPDGDYVYYDTCIPAASELTEPDDYIFVLEGKDDVTYDIVVGVPKYRSSKDPQIYTYKFSIRDTDDIVDDVVSGYLYKFVITGGTDFETPVIVESTPPEKNDENIIEASNDMYFPVADYLLGDVTLDEKVNIYDAIAIAKYVLDKNYFDQTQVLAGDYNNDGKVNIYDAIGIAKSVLSSGK